MSGRMPIADTRSGIGRVARIPVERDPKAPRQHKINNVPVRSRVEEVPTMCTEIEIGAYAMRTSPALIARSVSEERRCDHSRAAASPRESPTEWCSNSQNGRRVRPPSQHRAMVAPFGRNEMLDDVMSRPMGYPRTSKITAWPRRWRRFFDSHVACSRTLSCPHTNPRFELGTEPGRSLRRDGLVAPQRRSRGALPGIATGPSQVPVRHVATSCRARTVATVATRDCRDLHPAFLSGPACLRWPKESPNGNIER